MRPSPAFTPVDKVLCCARNIWCPHYDACLTAAARRNCQFDCGACPLREVEIDRFVLTLAEIRGCHTLLREIFFYSGETARAS